MIDIMAGNKTIGFIIVAAILAALYFLTRNSSSSGAQGAQGAQGADAGGGYAGSSTTQGSPDTGGASSGGADQGGGNVIFVPDGSGGYVPVVIDGTQTGGDSPMTPPVDSSSNPNGTSNDNGGDGGGGPAPNPWARAFNPTTPEGLVNDLMVGAITVPLVGSAVGATKALASVVKKSPKSSDPAKAGEGEKPTTEKAKVAEEPAGKPKTSEPTSRLNEPEAKLTSRAESSGAQAHDPGVKGVESTRNPLSKEALAQPETGTPKPGVKAGGEIDVARGVTKLAADDRAGVAIGDMARPAKAIALAATKAGSVAARIAESPAGKVAGATVRAAGVVAEVAQIGIGAGATAASVVQASKGDAAAAQKNAALGLNVVTAGSAEFNKDTGRVSVSLFGIGPKIQPDATPILDFLGITKAPPSAPSGPTTYAGPQQAVTVGGITFRNQGEADAYKSSHPATPSAPALTVAAPKQSAADRKADKMDRLFA